MKKCVIFAGGDFEIADFAERDRGLFAICADGGYRHAESVGLKPDVFIGDFDSFDGLLPENIEVHRSVPEKDDTDTMLAVKYAIENNFNYIIIYGGLGGRFDHTFANIQTLIYAFEKNCTAVIRSEKNIISVVGEGLHSYKKLENYYFSIFALTDRLEIDYLRGVKYPLENYVIRQDFPIGTSNEIVHFYKAELKINSGLALVVYSKM